MTREKDDPGFASRWSRLKQEAKADAPELGEAPEADAAPAGVETPVADDRPDEEVLE